MRPARSRHIVGARPNRRKDLNMKIILPDGSEKELENGATVADVAASIGAGLAKAALGGVVNGKEVDLSREVADGDQVSIITNKCIVK